jgi:hypothetical protein
MTTIDLPEFKFNEGDYVRKTGGTYEADGIIVGIAVTTRGDVRYLFEFEQFPGMLHIFNEGQLQHRQVLDGTFPTHG